MIVKELELSAMLLLRRKTSKKNHGGVRTKRTESNFTRKVPKGYIKCLSQNLLELRGGDAV